MKTYLYQHLNQLAGVLWWLDKHDESHAISMLARWLEINGVQDNDELADILSSCNDNPNLQEILTDDEDDE